MSDTRMKIAYASDDNYAHYMGISILSLLNANKGAESIDVYVLDSGIKDENRQKLLKISEEYGRNIIFIPVSDYIAKLDLHMSARKISVVAYARLFLASLLPEDCDRIIYLDCDTIVCDDLSGMWNAELSDNPVAGVEDTIDSFFLGAIGLQKGTRYLNSGILLMNIALWRRENYQERFLNFIRERDGYVPHHDQGVINGVCGDKRVILPLRYNVFSNIYSFTNKMIKRMYDLSDYYSQEEIDEARKNPAIIHFTTGLLGRPWEKNCHHPLKDKYTEASNMSPWHDMPLLEDKTKRSVRLAAFMRRLMPDGMFAGIYRLLSGLTHLRE